MIIDRIIEILRKLSGPTYKNDFPGASRDPASPTHRFSIDLGANQGHMRSVRFFLISRAYVPGLSARQGPRAAPGGCGKTL